jgi:hypothetical protein
LVLELAQHTKIPVPPQSPRRSRLPTPLASVSLRSFVPFQIDLQGTPLLLFILLLFPPPIHPVPLSRVSFYSSSTSTAGLPLPLAHALLALPGPRRVALLAFLFRRRASSPGLRTLGRGLRHTAPGPGVHAHACLAVHQGIRSRRTKRERNVAAAQLRRRPLPLPRFPASPMWRQLKLLLAQGNSEKVSALAYSPYTIHDSEHFFFLRISASSPPNIDRGCRPGGLKVPCGEERSFEEMSWGASPMAWRYLLRPCCRADMAQLDKTEPSSDELSEPPPHPFLDLLPLRSTSARR